MVAAVIPDPGTGLTTIATVFGNPDLRSEELLAYELGARQIVSDNFFVDIATFFNDYDYIRTQVPGDPYMDGMNVIAPINLLNGAEGTSYGAELAAEWQPYDRWKLFSSYSLLKMDIDNKPGFESALDNGSTPYPEHQFHVRSYLDVSDHIELNAAAYWVDELVGDDTAAYLRADASIVWRPSDTLALTLTAQNLFHDGETEFGESTLQTGSEVATGGYFMLTWTP